MFVNLAFYLTLLSLFLTFFVNRTSRVHAAGIALSVALTFGWLWAAICFREPYGDIYRYMLGLNAIKELRFSELFDYRNAPPGFLLLNWTVGQLSNASWFFLSSVYLIAIGSLYYAMRLFLGPLHGASALMLYSMYPFYVNYLASGLKQGLATGLLLVGIANLLARRKTGFVWLLGATLFHASTWLCIAVLLTWSAVPRQTARRLAPAVLAISFLLGATGLAKPIVESILPAAVLDALGFSIYFDKEFQDSGEFLAVDLVMGFRWDFALFTALPLFAWYRWRHRLAPLADLMVIYSLFASLYFVLAFIPYADRIAGFAWALIPLILYSLAFSAFDAARGRRIIVTTLAAYPALLVTYVGIYFG